MSRQCAVAACYDALEGRPGRSSAVYHERKGSCGRAKPSPTKNRQGAIVTKAATLPGFVRSHRRPKLGQHFLTDLRYRRRILGMLDLRSDDFVIEIGAGRGAMTDLLAERAGRVLAIEIDALLARKLQERAKGGRIDVLLADILSIDLSEICRRYQAKQCFVFGNLPYYITSPIIHHLKTFRTRIRAMALLMQREVALRLTASPGSRAYGYLSVLAQISWQPRILLSVPPGAFSPPPKVRSALVSFQTQPEIPEWKAADYEDFLAFAKRCFEHKRKNLVNNLSAVYSRLLVERALKNLSLPTSVRAEQLTVEQLASLFRHLKQG